MAGIDAISSYEPNEIRGLGRGDYIAVPCTVEKGNTLQAGALIGQVPVSQKFGPYDNDGVATASSPEADSGNTGDGAVSSIDVQDNYTLTEEWTLECTGEAENGGTFSVTGSKSGSAGSATVGSEFRYPDSSSYRVKFTISDGSNDFDLGDSFSFTTTAAKAGKALGILSENVEAVEGDVVSSMFIRGVFRTSKLTGLDEDAVSDLNGRVVLDLLII